MKKTIFLSFLLSNLIICSQSADFSKVKTQLDTVLRYDQLYRLQISDTKRIYGNNSAEIKNLWIKIKNQDSVNVILVTKIIDEFGWLSSDQIGNDANEALFLVIQHANLQTQEKYLPAMRQAVKDKKARGSSLALLEDRVLMRNGKKQLYGSQIQPNGRGGYEIYPIEDEKNVNIRRAEVGLGKLEDYVRMWDIKYKLPKE